MATGRGDLSAANCHAIVVGTGSHSRNGQEGLSDLPSAARSARAVAAILDEACGLEGRVTLIIDPHGPTEVLATVQAAIDASAGGVVIFYFVGHGLVGPGQQLYLATSGTSSLDDTVHAVPFDQVSKRLADALASTVVVLDCCFSGLAQAARPETYRKVLASARPEGSFLLASATHYAASYAPADADHTLFSGELLRLLTEGDPGGPSWFTFLDVYRVLDHRFQGSAARPHSDGIGRASDLVLARNPGRRAPDPTQPSAEQAGGPCPYPGMQPFLPEQHHLFFGREELTRSLVNRVTAGSSTGPVVLVGASGAGKSSLLRAGLVAALETETVLALLGPGARPFHSLVDRWATALGRPFTEVEQDLAAGRFGPRGPDVLVIDQLEEIFAECRDPEERELFIRALAGAGTDGPRIVLALRADFYDQALSDPRLGPIVRSGQFTVFAMSDAELRAAIEHPAEQAGLLLEDGLTDHILRELRQERALEGDVLALPFLAHALRQTWAGRTGVTLTFSAFQAAGAIRSSVARVADEVYEGLGSEDQGRVRELVLRMVLVVDDRGRAVRRRVSVDELGHAADLLQLLTTARLVVVDQDEAQLCHDSLIHAWPRLQDWITEGREGLLARRRLGDAADGWNEAGRPESGLYGGDQLVTVRTQLAAGRSAFPMRPVEQHFLDAGLRAEHRKKTRRRAVLALITVMAVVATSLAVWALIAQRDAERRETVLIANEIASQADALRARDPQTALRLSLAAYRTADTPETRSSLYAAYLTEAPVDLPGEHDTAVLDLAFSKDSSVLATSQVGGYVQLWDLSRRNVPVKAAALKLKGSAAIAFHPRSRLLAAQTATELTLWDVGEPERPRRFSERAIPRGMTYTLGFAPDGRTLAAGGEHGRLRLWDVSKPTAPALRTDRSVAAEALISLDFRHDGLMITGNGISGTGRTERPAEVRLWDVRDPVNAQLLDTAEAPTVMAVAAHPKRNLLVATGAEGSMTWWSAERGEQLVRAEPEDARESIWGYSSDLPALSFRPDGERLAAASHSAQQGALVRATTDTDFFTSYGERGVASSGEPAQSVAYSPDGNQLAVGDMAGNVRVWPQRAPAPRVRGAMTTTDPGTSSINGDGTLMVVATPAMRYQVWDLRPADTAEGKDPRVRFTLPEGWEARYFLPGTERSVLLAHRYTEGSNDHTFRLWDFSEDPTRPPVQGEEIRLEASDPRSAVSPDGGLLVLGDTFTATVNVWDVRDPLRPVRGGTITGAQITERESLFFVGDRGFAIIDRGRPGHERPSDLGIWDLTDPVRPFKVRILPDAGTVHALYVPSSRLLMHDAKARRTQLWDMRDVRKPRKAALLPAAPGGYLPVREGVLATILTDGTVQFWDVKNPQRARKIDVLRFEAPLDEIRLSPDGRRILTSPPYRVWDAGDGRTWRTPSLAALTGMKDVRLLPGENLFAAVVPARSWDGPPDVGLTYLIDLDTDGIHERMCTSHPLDVDEDLWKALFPHLDPRRSCDRR
ncbi:caspase, EACC1-associated type [Streptomyces clavifer]|uniref:caspase, EACC1-associated type n=1 Tax=Streptomyces clavifer TaxID=68188 RepID=UPI003093A325|nr:caspase family protein [Streptomyces clavifer]